MLIELGNHCDVKGAIDDRPKLTRIHIPEADEHGLGGYTHKPAAATVAEFKDHLVDSLLTRDGITQTPDHEILTSVVHPGQGAWLQHGNGAPAWVKVYDHGPVAAAVPDADTGELPTAIVPHSADVAKDIEAFLCEYWGVPSGDQHFGTTDLEELLVKKELQYWTRSAPGELPAGLSLPDATALYTDDGRVMNNNNDGGLAVGFTAAATATTATTLTDSGATWTSNQWAGCRVYAQSSTSNMVWGNIISNTSTALTIDRWYAVATPGGSAGSTPTSTSPFLIADGGMVSSWFVGLATGANAPAHADHTLATNGNAEITTAGGGLIRKIAPYAQTSGVASRAFTLTPVYTANGSDSLPATVTTIGVFTSMVTSFGGAGGPMKFETALGSSATLSSSGDTLTVTETVTGS